MRKRGMRPGQLLSTITRWLRLPLFAGALLTGAKSFRDNPLLGSRRLNELGLHAARVRLAHVMADKRRRKLARAIPAEWREQFDKHGFVRVDNFLPAETFERLRTRMLRWEQPARSHRQGDTITSRVPIGPEMIAAMPELGALLKDRRWQGLMAYVASTASPPLYYLQAIDGGVVEGPPDPQIELHADTFHPSLKAWLFLTDVAEEDRPLTYVAGSHRLTARRLAWEKARSLEVLDGDERLSQRGSLRISPEQLDALKLPQPTRFCVPANTLVAVDTFGFHARADAAGRSHRVELWGFCRRSPYLPWTGLDPLGWSPIAERRAQWLLWAVDWLDRRGWAKQHWRPSGPWPEITKTGTVIRERR